MEILNLVVKNIVRLTLSLVLVVAVIFGGISLFNLINKDSNPVAEEEKREKAKLDQVIKVDTIIANLANIETPKAVSTKDIAKTGTILAGQQVTVTPEIAGNIKELRVGEGSVVKKGDLLATLENSSQLKNAIIAYNSAITLLQNAERLLNITNQSGQVNLSTFQEQFQQAQLNVEKAYVQLESTQAIRYSQFEVADINSATANLQKRLTEESVSNSQPTLNTETAQTYNASSTETDYYSQYLQDAIEQNQNVSQVKSRDLEILQGQAQDDQNYINLESAGIQLSLLGKQMQLTELQNQSSIINAKNQIVQIRQQLESAKVSLSLGEIRSPINGMVSNLTVTNGSRINPGETILTVVNFDEIKVKLFLSPVELQTIASTSRQNLKIKIEVLGEEFEAKINYLGLIANPQTRTIPVELSPVFKNMNSKNKFIPNSFAKAKFSIPQELAVASNTQPTNDGIPLSALVKDGNELQVAVVKNGTASFKSIEIAPRITKGKVRILAGISNGDQIILNPTNLTNGSKVTTK